jgi:hypothetical protein
MKSRAGEVVCSQVINRYTRLMKFGYVYEYGTGSNFSCCAGGSGWATYWSETMRELAPLLPKSGYLTEKLLEEFHARYQDPHYWTKRHHLHCELGTQEGDLIRRWLT